MTNYDERAQKILNFLGSKAGRYSQELFDHPFCIEFAGTPDAGKTTTAEELYKYLRRLGFKVIRPQEGPEVIHEVSRKDPGYNLATGAYAIQNILKLTAGHTYDLVIIDRGPFDCFAWMEEWHRREKLSVEQKNAFQMHALYPAWTDRIDCCHFMVCEPQVAMERDTFIKALAKEGTSTNPSSIENFVKTWKKAHKKLLQQGYNQIHLWDTTKLSKDEMVEKILQTTLQAMEQRIEKKSKTLILPGVKQKEQEQALNKTQAG